MFSGNVSDIESELFLYEEMFKEGFPLMQAGGSTEKVQGQIKRCLIEGKKAEELWPEQYGACMGKLI